jgi:hypothetical protein
MGNRRVVLVMTMAFWALSSLCLLGYFLALHDIKKDYASPDTWLREGLEVPGWLPEWALCPLEWRMIEWGYWPILAFHVVFLAAAVMFFRGARQMSRERQ